MSPLFARNCGEVHFGRHLTLQVAVVEHHWKLSANTSSNNKHPTDLLRDAYGSCAIHPRPEGRGFSRILGKHFQLNVNLYRMGLSVWVLPMRNFSLHSV
jgi:hypothetical protein